MSKLALFSYNYGKDKMKQLEQLGYEIIIKKEKGLHYIEEFKDVEILVTYDPFDTLDISKMKNLKWIQLLSIGFNQVPRDTVKNNNIKVTNNKHGYVVPVAEWIVGKILEIYKNSNNFNENKKKRIWRMDFSLMELCSKTVGIVGTGAIALETAKRLKAFDTCVLGVNRDGRPMEYFNETYSTHNLNEMLKICDIVVSLVPSTPETYHLLDEGRFNSMKEGVVFINASRGDVVDEEKLIERLKNNRIKAAALDVFEKEPLDKESVLWDLENLIISPHNSWVSESRDVKIYNTIYENLQRYPKGEELINLVDIEKGY